MCDDTPQPFLTSQSTISYQISPKLCSFRQFDINYCLSLQKHQKYKTQPTVIIISLYSFPIPIFWVICISLSLLQLRTLSFKFDVHNTSIRPKFSSLVYTCKQISKMDSGEFMYASAHYISKLCSKGPTMTRRVIRDKYIPTARFVNYSLWLSAHRVFWFVSRNFFCASSDIFSRLFPYGEHYIKKIYIQTDPHDEITKAVKNFHESLIDFTICPAA